LIALSRLALSRAWARLRDAGWVQLEGVYEYWDHRLAAESLLLSHFVVPADIGAALVDLVRGLEDQSPESLVDWLDMLPRSALDLLSVQPVAVKIQSDAPIGAMLGNGPPVESPRPSVDRPSIGLAQAA
jgi:hypothetical protein